MELIGSNFAFTIGSWRLRLGFAIEEIDAVPTAKPPIPHRVRVVPEDDFLRREA
jgi:hypothetical protein